jgi:hypothetical protein
MTTITFVKFEEMVAERFKDSEKLEPGKMRIGQVYFNTLNEVRPDIANKMRGSMIDPFHKRRITQAVRNFVIENWYK